MDNLEDPSVLTGIAKLVNKQKVNNRINLETIERDLIGGIKPLEVKDTEAELTEILKDIRTTPINYVVASENKSKPALFVGGPTVKFDKPSIGTMQKYMTGGDKIKQFLKSNDKSHFEVDDDPLESKMNSASNLAQSRMETSMESTDDDSVDDGDADDIDVNTMVDEINDNAPSSSLSNPMSMLRSVNQPPPQLYSPMQQQQPYADMIPQQPVVYVQQQPPRPVYQIQQLPPGANYAQQALQIYSNTNNSQEMLLEQEALEDQKEKMLADIDELREELESENIKTNRIPEVNIDSTHEDVTKVYKQLKRKYDRSRCEDLGQNVILAGAKMIGMVFDGNKSYFGYRPDMTGWDRTVRSKLRRMRYEQSVIVSNALEYYNVGPIQRMGLELIPSAFLYSLTRKEQHGKDNYTPEIGPSSSGSTDDRSAALDDLRAFE